MATSILVMAFAAAAWTVSCSEATIVARGRIHSQVCRTVKTKRNSPEWHCRRFWRCNGVVVSAWAQNEGVAALVFFSDPRLDLRNHTSVNTFLLAAGALLGYDTRLETLFGSIVQVV